MTAGQIAILFVIVVLLLFGFLVLYIGHQHDKQQEQLKDIDKLGEPEPD